MLGQGRERSTVPEGVQQLAKVSIVSSMCGRASLSRMKRYQNHPQVACLVTITDWSWLWRID
jgi:hypothetical protein